MTQHQIDTGSARPIKMHPRRVPLHLQQEVADHIKQMLDNDIIRPSCSPWAAPVVPVRKKDGSLRFCVDYRKLNEVTVKDAYPLLRIDDALDSLANAQGFQPLTLPVVIGRSRLTLRIGQRQHLSLDRACLSLMS